MPRRRNLSADALAAADRPLWSVAWHCADCGEIALGPASIPDGPDWPWPPARGCRRCGAVAWIETRTPARPFSGPAVDPAPTRRDGLGPNPTPCRYLRSITR